MPCGDSRPENLTLNKRIMYSPQFKQSICKLPTRGIFHVLGSEDHVRVVQERIFRLVLVVLSATHGASNRSHYVAGGRVDIHGGRAACTIRSAA
jgi:hypothetical protein